MCVCVCVCVVCLFQPKANVRTLGATSAGNLLYSSNPRHASLQCNIGSRERHEFLTIVHCEFHLQLSSVSLIPQVGKVGGGGGGG